MGNLREIITVLGGVAVLIASQFVVIRCYSAIQKRCDDRVADIVKIAVWVVFVMLVLSVLMVIDWLIPRDGPRGMVMVCIFVPALIGGLAMTWRRRTTKRIQDHETDSLQSPGMKTIGRTRQP